MIKYLYEYTDTFGGEANYSWVRRGEVNAKDIKHAFRLARKELELNGVKGKMESWSPDDGRWSPYGICTVLFVNYKEEQ